MGTLALLGGSIGLGCREESEDTSIRTRLETDTTDISALSDLVMPTGAEAVMATWPDDLPPYFRETYLAAMHAQLPTVIAKQETPAIIPQLQYDRNPAGYLGSFQPGGATATATNAFFQPLGTNGRTCFTCHQTQDGMGLSVRTVRARFNKTQGNDPLFAPVDGANCPNQVPRRWPPASPAGYAAGMKSFVDSHSLLLNKGLIRIPISVPANAEFTIEVVSDPTTCNTDPAFNTNTSGARIVSIFRRPLISANLNFKLNTLDFFPPGTSPLTNIMADGREPSLRSQAIDATLGHAQATRIPTQAQIDQIIAFEMGIFDAQACDDRAGKLDANGATGGPVFFAAHGNDGPTFGVSVFDEFDAWKTATGPSAAQMQAIARGQDIFHGRGGASGTRGTFTLSNVAGFNDFPGIPPAVPGACATCHNFGHAGSDFLARSQRDIGTGGHGAAIGGPALAKDLPVFKLTCPTGSFLWDPNLTTVLTNDPAKALITGKCRDIGAKTVPSLRGLASREPLFNDGSAASLVELVDIYDKRFSIGLTPSEKYDLISFLVSL